MGYEFEVVGWRLEVGDGGAAGCAGEEVAAMMYTGAELVYTIVGGAPAPKSTASARAVEVNAVLTVR